MNNFKEAFVQNLQQGILLLVKYGFIIATILYVFAFMNNTWQMASNGNGAAIAINQLIAKGYLPRPVNGEFPNK